MTLKAEDVRYVFTEDGDGNPEAIMFTWGIDNFGFGTTTFAYRNGKLVCDSETMSRDDIKMILCDFVDRATFLDGKDEGPGLKQNPSF